MSEQKYWPNCEKCKGYPKWDPSFDAQVTYCWNCGAKRPEEKKDELVELLKRGWIDGKMMSIDLFYENLAKLIREWLKNKIDKLGSYGTSEMGPSYKIGLTIRRCYLLKDLGIEE